MCNVRLQFKSSAVPHRLLLQGQGRIWRLFHLLTWLKYTLLWQEEGWKLNRNNYYQEGWLATGNVRGVVGVTFTSSHARRPHELPLRTNYNLRGHRSDVSICKHSYTSTYANLSKYLNWILTLCVRNWVEITLKCFDKFALVDASASPQPMYVYIHTSLLFTNLTNKFLKKFVVSHFIENILKKNLTKTQLRLKFRQGFFRGFVKGFLGIPIYVWF